MVKFIAYVEVKHTVIIVQRMGRGRGVTSVGGPYIMCEVININSR